MLEREGQAILELICFSIFNYQTIPSCYESYKYPKIERCCMAQYNCFNIVQYWNVKFTISEITIVRTCSGCVLVSCILFLILIFNCKIEIKKHIPDNRSPLKRLTCCFYYSILHKLYLTVTGKCKTSVLKLSLDTFRKEFDSSETLTSHHIYSYYIVPILTPTITFLW